LTARELGRLQVLPRLLWRGFLPLLRNPNELKRKLKRGIDVLKRGGLGTLVAHLVRADDLKTRSYETWIERYDTLSERDRALIVERIAELSYRPTVSVIMPVYNTPEEWLRHAIDSVRRQLYPEWELCIADDASSASHVRNVLEEYAERDARIRVRWRRDNGGIAAASGSALEMASGEYIALLDHDDELTEHALYMVVEELNAHSDADLLYSDEDKIDERGRRFEPWFKSDFNYDLLLSQNCIVHLGVYRTELVRQLGGFQKGTDGSQDYDLALRVVEATEPNRIRHIPHVLYHWRTISGSVARHPAQKSYPYDAARKALQEHLDHKAAEAEVVSTFHLGYYRVQYRRKDTPRVSVIIPDKDRVGLLEICVDGVLNRTDYTDIELLIVNNRSEKPETFRYFDSVRKDPRVRVLDYDAPFNYAALNNWAVRQAKGNLIAFLNNDTEVISKEWLSEMVSHALRPEVGAVGAKLYYPNDTIQHGGILVGIGGLAGHAHHTLPRKTEGYFGRAVLVQNLSAVTAACMVLRRKVFEDIGGFDTESFSVAFNDVDLCLRIGARGYRIVWTPYAELYHHESASVGLPEEPQRRELFERESEFLRERWREVIEHDPAYNPNLTLLGGDFSPAFPPRARKPWLENTPD
jgi:GT2 family glycosyltransferase